MNVNDYAEPSHRSPLLDWVIACAIPFVCLVVLLLLRFAPDWIEYIKVRLA